MRSKVTTESKDQIPTVLLIYFMYRAVCVHSYLLYCSKTITVTLTVVRV